MTEFGSVHPVSALMAHNFSQYIATSEINKYIARLRKLKKK